MTSVTSGTADKDAPRLLQTPAQTLDHQAWRDDGSCVLQVATIRLSCQWRAIADAWAMLAAHGNWMALGNADRCKPT